jgi:glycosyltransferase involved in cell wall biosynthesis
MTGAIRVVFDHRIFAIQAYGGISRYFAGIAPLLGAHGIAPRIAAPLHVNHYLGALPPGLVWGQRIPEWRGARRLSLAAGNALAGPLARLAGAQIVHETYFGAARLAPRGVRLVLTVYDMIHELFAEEIGDAAARADKAAAIARADRILCISHSTLGDLLRFYPEAEGRAAVTHLGFDAATFTPGAAPGAGERPYLLHVGHRRAYKNFAGLLGAYAASPRLRAEFDLVCGGGAPFDPAERELIAGHGLEGRVRRVAANDATLAALYAGAALFVYPSLYEGFGIPPLEAMAAGCPVVAVRASSVPEVCGDAAHFAADGSPEALAEAIEAVVWSPRRQAELRAAGAERIKGFTWEATAAMTAACYKELV